MPLNLSIAERISQRNRKVKRGRWACIESGYAKTKGGYAHMGVDGKFLYVHRLAWELVNGPIPKDMTIDHRCRNRACCNVKHLRLMDGVHNMMIGEAPSAKNARKTQCQKGHTLSGTNLKVRKNGERGCRICINAYARKWKANSRAPAG